MFEGRYAEAVHVMEQGAKLAPGEAPNNYRVWGNLGDAYWLARSYADKRDAAWRQAAQVCERQLNGTAGDAEILSHLAKYHAKLGHRSESMERAAEALKYSPASAMVHYQVSLAYTLLGEKERGFAELAVAVEHGYSVNEIRVAPELARLRSDPRFDGITKRDGRR